MYSPQQAIYALALGTAANLFFKSKGVYLILLSILLYKFPEETWLFAIVESISYFIYQLLNNNKLPIRMATLNLIWIGCFVIWRQRQVLDFPDILKLNAFFLGWLLGLVYVKNKILLIWKFVRRNKEKKE